MIQALVKHRALEIGFDLVGIAPVAAYQDLKFSREWVERGYGGEMQYLENPKRDDPRRILPSAQSVICVGLVYNADLPYSTEVRRQESGVRSQETEARIVGNRERGSRKSRVTEEIGNSKFETRRLPTDTRDLPRTTDEGPGTEDGLRISAIPTSRGWISRYAWGEDYHKIMRAKLERLRASLETLSPGVETRVYVDTGPIVERAFARLSGIGWTGKNTCLINESKGSWIFLGVMITSLDLTPDLPAPDRCGSCTACIEACPTEALVEPYVMDASRCISYLTIELKGSIPQQFRSAIGANIAGCDICQDVCPWNSKGGSQQSGVRSQNFWVPRGAATTTRPEFQPMQLNLDGRVARAETRTPNPQPRNFSLFNPPLDALASMDEAEFRAILRHSPVKRIKYRGWLRNLCVVMGNSGDSRFLQRLQHLREHGDPIIREHAEWAILELVKMRPSASEPGGAPASSSI